MAVLPDDELLRFLNDDCLFSDLTTDGLGIADVAASATFTAKGDMVLCGVEEAGRMFALAGASAEFAARSRAVVLSSILGVASILVFLLLRRFSRPALN